MMYSNNPLGRNGTWWESVLGHTLVYCILQIMFSTNINAILKGCFCFFYLSIVVEQAMDLPSVNVLFYLCFIPNSWVTMCNTNTINLSAWTSYAATINILPDKKEYFLLLIKRHWIPISWTSLQIFIHAYHVW